MSVSDQNKVSSDDAQIIQIEDPTGNYVAAVKPASGSATAADPALVVAFSPNSPLPASTGTIGAVNLHDGDGNSITSQLVDTVSNYRALHNLTPDRTIAATALNALNAAVTVSMEGQSSTGFQLAAGTFAGTVTAEQSVDGGTSWVQALFFDPATQVVSKTQTFTNPNSLTILGLISIQGVSHVRVRVSAYTSGTANAIVRSVRSSGFQVSIPFDKADTDSNSSFSWAIGSLNLATASTNNPLVLLRNPSSSTKNVYLKSITCGIIVTNTQAEFLVYATPTVTANGTAQTAQTRTIGSGASAQLLVTTLPTISSNGSILSSFNNAQNSNSLAVIDSYQLKMPPNTSLLLTGNPSANNRAAAITIVWSEI